VLWSLIVLSIRGLALFAALLVPASYAIVVAQANDKSAAMSRVIVEATTRGQSETTLQLLIQEQEAKKSDRFCFAFATRVIVRSAGREAFQIDRAKAVRRGSVLARPPDNQCSSRAEDYVDIEGDGSIEDLSRLVPPMIDCIQSAHYCADFPVSRISSQDRSDLAAMRMIGIVWRADRRLTATFQSSVVPVSFMDVQLKLGPDGSKEIDVFPSDVIFDRH
jgi:hypothetical protein